MTRTNGSSLPSSASYQAWHVLLAGLVGEDLVVDDTFGIPGIAPVMMSSRLGFVAEVIATEVALAGQPDGHPQDVGRDRLRRGLVGCELHLLPSASPFRSADPRQRVAHELVHDAPCRRRPSPRAPSPGATSSLRRSPRRRRHRPRCASPPGRPRAPSGATIATKTPSLATCIGSMPSSSAAPATAGGTGTSASRTSIATPDARGQLVQHGGHAAARRVAQAAQVRAGAPEQRVDRRPQAARVGLDVRRRARTRRGRA